MPPASNRLVERRDLFVCDLFLRDPRPSISDPASAAQLVAPLCPGRFSLVTLDEGRGLMASRETELVVDPFGSRTIGGVATGEKLPQLGSFIPAGGFGGVHETFTGPENL
jgi:hypothetical protein